MFHLVCLTCLTHLAACTHICPWARSSKCKAAAHVWLEPYAIQTSIVLSIVMWTYNLLGLYCPAVD